MRDAEEPTVERMADRTETATAGRAVVTMAALVIVVAGMRAASAIVVPFLLSIFIAVVVSPLFVWLKRRGIRSAVALLAMIVMLVVVGFGFVWLVGTSLNEFLSSQSDYQADLQKQMKNVIGRLESWGIKSPEPLVLESLSPEAALGFVGGMVGSLAALLSNAFLILLTVIFILLEAAAFPDKLRSAPGPMRKSLEVYEKIIENIRRYMAMKTWISLLTGVLVGAMLAAIGVQEYVLLGLIAFLLNYVPNIGSILAAVPGVLLAWISQGPAEAIGVGAGYLAINLVIGNVVEPRIMGRGLGLSTLVVFLSLVFWGWVLGPVGMLLSAPLTMAVKITLESSEQTRWFALLLGSELPAILAEPSEPREESGEAPVAEKVRDASDA